MMTVRLRLAFVLARWWLRDRKQEPQTLSRLTMRCLWTDCDINLHMNNSRYLALMDVGRYHYLLTTGLFQEVVRRRWVPVLVRAEIDFKKSLKPGDRFVLETQLERLSTKSATLSQRFWLGDVLVAEARAIGLFLHLGKPAELAEAMGAFVRAQDRVASVDSPQGSA